MRRKEVVEALTCVLSSSLIADTNVQKMVMNKLKQLEVIEEYPEALCHIIGSNRIGLPERHFAATVLKNYLEEIYTNCRENNGLYSKKIGQKMVFLLIEHLNTRCVFIKQMVAYNLGILLSLGFWDEATSYLNDMIIYSSDINNITNAVLVLHLAIDERYLLSNHKNLIKHNWFDILLQVLQKETLPSEVRANCIHPMFMMILHLRPNPSFAPDCLGKVTMAIINIFNEPYSINCQFQLKTEIFRCLNKAVPKLGAEYGDIFIPPILPAMGNLLVRYVEIFTGIVKGDDPPRDANEEEDSHIFFELVNRIMQFVLSLIDTNYFDFLFTDLHNLIYCVYVFMACHSDMENFLFEEPTESSHHYSLRKSCSNIITFCLETLSNRRPNGRALFFQTMHEVFERLSSKMDPECHEDIRKIFFTSRIAESMMFGTGLVRSKYSLSDLEFVFPLNYWLDYWTILLRHSNVLIMSRAIWLGGIYASEIPYRIMIHHFRCIVASLEGDSAHMLLPCTDAVGRYLKILHNMEEDKKNLVKLASQQILECLITISKRANSFTLQYSLNAIGYLIKANPGLAERNITNLEDLLISMFTLYSSDYYIVREINFMCSKLAQSNAFSFRDQNRFLHFLNDIILDLDPERQKRKNDVDKALDVINTICVYANNVEDNFLLQEFSLAARRFGQSTSRDSEIDESAARLMLTILTKFKDRLSNFSLLPHRHPNLDNLPDLIEAFLQNDFESIPNNVIGLLIVSTIYSLPTTMEPFYEIILRNVITSCIGNSLGKLRTNWLVFIFITMIRTDVILKYLSGLPGPLGGSALAFILELWLPEYFYSIERIERKTIALSIIQILKNCLDDDENYSKMKEVSVPYDTEYGDTTVNGMEWLYFLLIQCLLSESRVNKEQLHLEQPCEIKHFGEDDDKRREEEMLAVFENHPFNINIIERTVDHLKNPTEAYHSVVRRLLSLEERIMLKTLGCHLPEIPEAMEGC